MRVSGVLDGLSEERGSSKRIPVDLHKNGLGSGKEQPMFGSVVRLNKM